MSSWRLTVSRGEPVWSTFIRGPDETQVLCFDHRLQLGGGTQFPVQRFQVSPTGDKGDPQNLADAFCMHSLTEVGQDLELALRQLRTDIATGVRGAWSPIDEGRRS